MALTHGMRLGAYEIVALIGAGGMGEVYRARDTRLDRTVAIKVLPTHRSPPTRSCASASSARRARSRRSITRTSARSTTSAHRTDPASVDRSFVLEYLEGETLAERLTRGPLPSRSRGAAHRHRDRRRARQGASLGHRPSRSQAGERHADQGGRQAARLRPREERRAGRRGQRPCRCCRRRRRT